jgi:predicted secreted hydrolase
VLIILEKKEYNIEKLGSFDDEWVYHKGCQDWWYATGYFSDADGNRYSYQFTILNLKVGIFNPLAVMIALTDFQTGKHHYRQNVSLGHGALQVTKKMVSFKNIASAEKLADGMHVKTNHSSFQLDLNLDYGKGAFWHCDNVKLQMGLPDKKETTYYYSYTNMPTKGILKLNGKEIPVTGKSWFDKQGGSYTLGKSTSWEWFSLRFYDDEEMMLFKFPVTGYQDGTFISKDGKRERLNNYKIKTAKFVEVDGSKFSAGWDLFVPGKKEEKYVITPMMDGCMNLAYFEELCTITNFEGKEVGMCFVELLPHLYDNNPTDKSNLFKNIEY